METQKGVHLTELGSVMHRRTVPLLGTSLNWETHGRNFYDYVFFFGISPGCAIKHADTVNELKIETLEKLCRSGCSGFPSRSNASRTELQFPW